MRKITANMIEKFRKYLLNEEKSTDTVEKYIRDVKSFKKWVDGRKILKAEMLLYKEHLIELYAPASVNSILSSLV